MALPSATPVTLPVLSTVATEVSLLLHVTVLIEASSGAIVAVNCDSSPTAIASDVGLTVIPVTGTFFTNRYILGKSLSLKLGLVTWLSVKMPLLHSK